MVMSFFLGWVRVRIDRSKPLSSQPEVFLDTTSPVVGADGIWERPPGTIEVLFLDWDEHVPFIYASDSQQKLSIEDCVAK